jgi:hypothetical protein
MFLNCNDFLPFESKIVFIRLGSDSGFASLLVSDQSGLRLSSDVKTFYKRVLVVEELCHLWSPNTANIGSTTAADSGFPPMVRNDFLEANFLPGM